MYGFVNKFVVRKTGLEVVESYLDIYARFELNRASCLYRCFLKTAHIAQERREILVVFGELWVHRDGLSEQSLRLLKIPIDFTTRAKFDVSTV
jgi:hypothetical protein